MNLVSREDYLEHHGILGQKWGVRRYQNSDGTLTSEGKKRLVNKRESSNLQTYKEKTEAYKIRTDRIKTMSDQELSNRLSRLEKEKKVRELDYEQTYPGRKVAKDILSGSGSVLASAARKYGVALAVWGIGKAVEKVAGKEVSSAINGFIKKK